MWLESDCLQTLYVYPMKHFKYLLATLTAAALAGHSASLLAQGEVLFKPWAAGIKVSKGLVKIIHGEKTYSGHVGAKLKEGDIVITSEDGSVGLLFLDNSTLSMGPNSEVVLTRYNYDPTTFLGAFDVHVKQGNVSLKAGDLAESGPDNVRVTTPQAELKGNAKQLLISVGDTK